MRRMRIEEPPAEPRVTGQRVDDLGRGTALAATPWYAVIAARARMRAGMDLTDALGPLQLTLRTYTLLELALEEPELAQRDLAVRIALDERQVVHLVTELERLGYVERVASTADRRVRNVRLTDAGRDVAERAGAIVREREAACLGRLSPAERAMLVELLGKIGTDA